MAAINKLKIENGYGFVYLIATLILSCICALVFIARIGNAPEGFRLMFLLPLLYGFLFLCTDVNKAMFRYPGITVLNLILTVRYIILPLFFCITGIYYHSNAAPTQPEENVLALILMIYEMFCIMLIMHFVVRKLEKERQLNKKRSDRYYDNYLIYYIAIAIGLFGLIASPEIRERLNFIVSRDSVTYSNLNIVNTLFFLLTTNVQNLLLILIIRRQNNNVNNGTKTNIISLLIVSLINIAAFWSSNRLTIVAQCIAVILLIRAVLPVKKKSLNIFLGILMLIIIISMSGSRWFGSGELFGFKTSFLSKFNLSQTADYLQAYFGGPHLISTAIAARAQFKSFIGIDTFIAEILSSILFIRQIPFAGSISTTVFFNYKFGFINFLSMILPTLGQSYMLFGIIAAPLLSVIFCILIYMVEKRIIYHKNIGEKFAYYILLIWLAFFPMQNLNIITATIFNRFLPLYLIIFINRKITLYREAKKEKLSKEAAE